MRKLTLLDQPVSSVATHIAIGAESLGIDSRASQIELSVANGSPPYFFGALFMRKAEMGPAVRYTLGRNTASVMI